MQAHDTTFIRPGVHAHILYIDCRPGKDGGPVIDERVVFIREIDPDGLGFHGWCVRRWWENRYTPGYSCRRRFKFDRVLWGQEWDGKRIANGAGLVVIPALDAIEWLADRQAEEAGAA